MPLSLIFPWLIAALLVAGWAWSVRQYRKSRRQLDHTVLKLTRINQAVESASDAIGIGDFEGNSVYHNRAHMELCGYTVDELNAVPEEGPLFADKTVAMQIHTSIRDGKSWQGETDIKTKGGRLVPAFVRADIIRDERGRPIGIFGVFSDITERRAAEKALADERERSARAQRLESLGMLAGGVAHDFGNLLTIIIGNTSVMRHAAGGLSESVEKRAAEIDKAAWRAQDLAKNLLAFARGSAPQLKRICLPPLLSAAARGAVQHSEVELEIDLPADLNEVLADPVQIDQVISNLCVNSVQAMEGRAGSRLTITAQNLANWPGSASNTPFAGRVACIKVSDNGKGIPANVLPRIWEPFYTTKAKGTGLGLATVYAVIKKHGGAISVESPPGAGTTFTIVLPAAKNVPDPITDAALVG